jgi:flagellar assembly protein FliH
MKTPHFMEGTKAVKSEAMKLTVIDPSRIRNVSWAPAPIEPALPQVEPVVREVKLGVGPSTPLGVNGTSSPELSTEPSLAPVFVPLPSEPAFSPAAEQQLHAALVALKNQGERLAEQARSDSLELGILIARRILERELSSNLDGVFCLIKSAIRRAGEDHVTRVRLSPGDVARFQGDAITEFSLGKIELVGDASLQPGDVMVDTASHTIDGRLSTRFEELVRQLDGNAS